MIPHIHPLGEPTPTVRELAERNDGSAVAIDWNAEGKATKWRLMQKGYDLLGEIMRRNAAATLARGTAGIEAEMSVVMAAGTPEESETESTKKSKGASRGSKSKPTPS